MRFRHCPDCGGLLTARDLGDEKNVPWCDSCGVPWFPVFPCAIIALVYNDNGEVLLQRQDYISTSFRTFVSGYMVPGENAEECARREILEETGLHADHLELILTSWFERKGILMIGFFAHVLDTDLKLSCEVDEASWTQPEKILNLISQNPESAARKLAQEYLKRRIKEIK